MAKFLAARANDTLEMQADSSLSESSESSSQLQ